MVSALIWGRLKSLWNSEHQQNSISSSRAHYQHSLNVSLKSVHNFLSYFADKRRLSHNFFGRGNYSNAHPNVFTAGWENEDTPNCLLTVFGGTESSFYTVFDTLRYPYFVSIVSRQ